jgi:hypothetical protein
MILPSNYIKISQHARLESEIHLHLLGCDAYSDRKERNIYIVREQYLYDTLMKWVTKEVNRMGQQ